MESEIKKNSTVPANVEKYLYAKNSEDVFNLLPVNISKIDLKK